MVANVLVSERTIEDGRKFLTGLVRGGFDVSVAFWAQTEERGPWNLYIASSQVVPGGIGRLAPQLYDQWRQLAGRPAFEYGQIRLLSATDPTAREAIEHRDRDWGRRSQPVQMLGRLGDLPTDGAFIYERITAELTRDEVIQKVLSLMERPGPQQPSKLIRRDGSMIQGIPVGLLTRAPGTELLVSLFDPVTRSTDYVPATEIVNIE
ncbi:MAG: hypothetical protein J0I06_03560 [Planctomycetes bacterium]|nr:hypothetical protein [Planctomycetota bacterium]